MIKTYPSKAAYEAAEKSVMESTVSLIENTNRIAINGVNVVVDDPKVGDIVCYDEDRKIKFIALDTFQAGTFPAAWETVGVVVLRKGNQVKIVSKTNETKKWMDVYPYIVSGYELDGMEHSAQLRLHGKPTTETFYEFKFTASTVDEFVTALQLLLTTNGETDWSAYKDGEDRVILQYDNYTSAEYYTSAITYATGLILTAKVTIDCSQQPNFWRKCGNRGSGVWHAAKAKEYFRSDLSSTAYNPASDVSSVPIYPVCWPAFAGTSQYQEDHCLWLRQQYCADPAHPTEEEWERYIDDIVHIIPYMLAGHAPKWRDGKALSDPLKNITYRAADGSQKPLYQGINYCAQFLDGKGYLPSMSELIECFGNVTYGLSGVDRDKSDAINRALFAIGGTAVQCNSAFWLSGRAYAGTNWVAYSAGGIDNVGFYGSRRCCPLALLEIY